MPTWVSDNIKAFGYTKEEVYRTPSWWRDRIHPDDRAVIEPKPEQVRTLDRFAHEYRFRLPDGSYCWIRDHHVRDPRRLGTGD